MDDEMQKADAIRARQQFLREMYLAGFDKAAGFMALIITAGYAAAFTIWDRVDRFLTYSERMLTASLFLISVGVFIGWQIRGQWVLSQQQLKIADLIAAGETDFDALMERFRADGAKTRRQLNRALPLIFALTSGFGALGMIILLIVCAQHFALGHE